MSTNFEKLKRALFAELAAFEYADKQSSDKTQELTDTCARLAAEKADLEEKIKELTDTIAKLSVAAAKDKQIIHG